MNKQFKLLVLLISLLGNFACTKKVDLSEKVINLVIVADVKGLDPIEAGDRYSSNQVGHAYEGLLEYHYLKRPYTLIPNLAEAMPTVSKDGLTYTFKIKKGVLFHDDKSFPKGIGRELIAEDFVYSLKRLANPKLQGLGWWILDGKIKGLNAFRENIKKLNKVDYSEVVEGIKSLDKYTLQFKLAKPFPQFLYTLAMTYSSVVAKEAVEFYDKEFLNHPVGTGPFILPEFKRTGKIIWRKNPKYRKKFYPNQGDEKFAKLGFLQDAGKQLPLVDKIVYHILIEDQTRWLNFAKGKIDYIEPPKDNFASAITPAKDLTPDLMKKQVSLMIVPNLDVTYTAFNLDLKLFQNKKLRQAFASAIQIHEVNDLLWNGNSLSAQSIIPPGIAGYDPNYMNPFKGPKLEQAKRLLSEAGYPKGKGLPEITYDCTSSTKARQTGELLQKHLGKIGIKVKVVQNTWPKLTEKVQKRQIMLYGMAWGADYPDGENFLQLLYGPNRPPGANGSGYNNPIFNKLFEKASTMQHSKQRTGLYEKLNQMVAEDMPLLFTFHRQAFGLSNKWLKNFITTDFESTRGQYINVDPKLKAKLIKTF